MKPSQASLLPLSLNYHHNYLCWSQFLLTTSNLFFYIYTDAHLTPSLLSLSLVMNRLGNRDCSSVVLIRMMMKERFIFPPFLSPFPPSPSRPFPFVLSLLFCFLALHSLLRIKSFFPSVIFILSHPFRFPFLFAFLFCFSFFSHLPSFL